MAIGSGSRGLTGGAGHGPAPDPAVAELTKDWKRLKAQKSRFRGGVEARMLLAIAMVAGEQAAFQARDTILTRPLNVDEERNHLSLVFNLLKKHFNKKVGRLWSVNYGFRASPTNTREPRAADKAKVATDLLGGLSRKLLEQQQHWQRLSWLLKTGVVIEHTPWIEEAGEEAIPAYDPETNELLWRDNQNPNPKAVLTQSQVMAQVQAGATPERFSVIKHLMVVGDVGSEIVSGLNFFIDSAVPTIRQLGPKQRCYIAQIKSVDWIRENFGNDAGNAVQTFAGQDLGIVQTRLLDKGPSLSNYNLRDLIPAIQGSRDINDPPMTIVLTGYEPACRDYPHGRRVIFIPHNLMLDDAECPYGEIPCTDIHYEAPTVNFWTGDFVTDLCVPQKFLNKRLSQLGEAANAQLYELLLLGGDLGKDDIPTDIHGTVEGGLDEEGRPLVVPMKRAELPQFFVESIKLCVDLIGALGAAEITANKQYPGQIRGPMVLPLLQEILDSEDGPFYSHLAEQLSLIHQQRLNRVRAFYPPLRTLQYTGADRKDAVLIFHADEILRSGVSFNVTYDPSSIVPEFSALREARIMERLASPLAGLYADRRTGRIDYSKIARELRYTDYDDADRQTQYRDLAQHLIARIWDGEPISQTLPQVPYPMWDHSTVLDEIDAVMATTEFLEASPQVVQEFQQLYEKCRQYMAAIQDAQMQAVQNQMIQGAVAQATQQVAAKTAAATVDASEQQIATQSAMAHANAQPPGGGGGAGHGPMEAALMAMTRRQIPTRPQ